MSLIKKLFWPKKDYIQMIQMSGIEELDGFCVNKFLKLVSEKNGKIIKIDPIQKLNAEYWSDDGTYSNAVSSGVATESDNFFMIHYKSLSEIKYTRLEDKEYLQLKKEIRTKNL